ncbi:hypothetical protein GVX76_03420 [[Haemophilus] felis]|nr:hypothetical protein [[Haemophilus] felis]
MKKYPILITSLLVLSACAQKPPKAEKAIIDLPYQSLVPTGFLIIEPESQRFVDLNLVQKQKDSPHLVHFDVVTNLTQGIYAYPEAENDHAKSSRKKHSLNCQSQEVVQLNEVYYSDFWGKGKASPTNTMYKKVVKSYTETPLHLLGKLMCAELYVDKNQ